MIYGNLFHRFYFKSFHLFSKLPEHPFKLTQQAFTTLEVLFRIHRYNKQQKQTIYRCLWQIHLDACLFYFYLVYIISIEGGSYLTWCSLKKMITCRLLENFFYKVSFVLSISLLRCPLTDKHCKTTFVSSYYRIIGKQFQKLLKWDSSKYFKKIFLFNK